MLPVPLPLAVPPEEPVACGRRRREVIRRATGSLPVHSLDLRPPHRKQGLLADVLLTQPRSPPASERAPTSAKGPTPGSNWQPCQGSHNTRDFLPLELPERWREVFTATLCSPHHHPREGGAEFTHMLAEKTCSRGDAKGTGWCGGRWGVSPFSTPAFYQAADFFPTLINLFETDGEGLHRAWASPTNTPYF